MSRFYSKKLATILVLIFCFVIVLFGLFELVDFVNRGAPIQVADKGISNARLDLAPSAVIIKGAVATQLPIMPGEPIRWTVKVSAATINAGQHLLTLPKNAEQVNIIPVKALAKTSSTASLAKSTKVDRLELSHLSKQNALSPASIALSLSLKKQSVQVRSFGFLSTVWNVFSKVGSSITAAVEDAIAPDAPAQDTTSPDSITPEVMIVDVAPEAPVAQAPIVSDTVSSSESVPAVETPSAETSATSTNDVQVATVEVATTTSIISTDVTASFATSTPILGDTPIATSTQSATTTATTTDILVEYKTPAPVIAEATTDTGKIVTVSDGLPAGTLEPNNASTTASTTNELPHPTNVLAFTNIPEIYKVGQENKIQIKWKNNNDQPMEFHAYDLNHNGKLDYVEWTVPHLSEQVFEIIFISKAFRLDADKNITEDIYDTVAAQDGNYATVPANNYIRATFEQILNNTKDITIYARSSTPGVDADVNTTSVEVFPVYDDGNGNLTEGSLVATFPTIDHEGTYKILLTNLQTPTDVFDLKIIGSMDIDYIVDPSSGPLSPGTMATSNASGGTSDWTTPDNAKVEDGNEANATAAAMVACRSLAGDTIVSTKEGNKAIRDLKSGDLVYSYNLISGKIELKEASNIVSVPIACDGNKYYHIYFDSGDIRATYNHFFYVDDKLVMARDLKIGDELLDINGRKQPITQIVIEENYTDDVWDISVEDNQNFFANGVLVHNSGVYDHRVRIIKGGAIGSTDKASGTAWPSSLAYTTYGSSSDFWGETGWTAEIINASDFGVAFSAYGSGEGSTNSTTYYLKATNFGFSIPTGSTINGITVEIKKRYYYDANVCTYYARVDHIRITVDYTAAPSDPADSYWVGGTGSWSEASTHWALTSNGAADVAALPGATTNVHFDPNSGGGTATVDSAVSVATVVMDTNNTTAVTLGNTLATTGNFTVSAGTLAVGTQTLAVTGNSTVTGGTVTIGAGATGWTTADMTIGASGAVTASGNSLIGVSGNWDSSAGTFTSGTSTVTFNGATTGYTIKPAASGGSFYNLTFNGTGGEWSPLTNTVTVTNDLTMTAGAFNTAAGTANVTVNGNVACGATCGTISMTAANTFTQNVAVNKNFGTSVAGTTVWTFYNLTFARSTGTPTITTSTTGSGDITVNNVLTIAASTILNAGNRTWHLMGTGTPFLVGTIGSNSYGSLIPNASTFSFEATSGIIVIASATTYYNLQTSPASGTVTYTLGTMSTGGGGSAPCFLAGTQVLTDQGESQNIEDLQTGDAILSYDMNAHQPALSHVSRVIKNSVDQYYIINNKVQATANHVFILADYSQKAAADLNVGDVLATYAGTETIKTIERVDQQTAVYDIEVAGYHLFYANGYLVHNDSVWPVTVNNNFTLTGAGAGTVTTATVYASLTVNGNFIIGSGQTFIQGGLVAIKGNFTNSGTFTSSGTVFFEGSSTQTINSGGSSFYNVFLSNNAFTLLTNAMTVGGNLVISEAKTPIITATTNEAFTVTGTTNGTTGGSAETLTVNTAGAVTFTGAVGSGVSTKLTILTITNSAALTFGGAVNIIGALTQTNAATGATTFSSTLAAGSATFNGTTINLGGTTTISGTLTLTAGTFATGAYAVTNGGMTLQGGTLTGSGTIAINGNLTYTSGTNSHTGAWTQGTGNLRWAASATANRIANYNVASGATITLLATSRVSKTVVPSTATMILGGANLFVGYTGEDNSVSLEGSWSTAGGQVWLVVGATSANNNPIKIGSVTFAVDAYPNTATLTQTGDIICGTLNVFAEIAGQIGTLIASKITTGSVILGYPSNSGSGSLSLGSGTHSIASIAAGNAANLNNAIDFGTSSTTISGTANLTNIKTVSSAAATLSAAAWTLDSSATNNLTWTSTGALNLTGPVTLSQTAGTTILNLGTYAATFTVGAGVNALNLNGGTLQGSGALTFNGGLLYTSGTNSHTGAWTQGTGNLGGWSSDTHKIKNYIVASGATITVTSGSYAGKITVPADATIVLGVNTLRVRYPTANDFASIAGTWTATSGGFYVDIDGSAPVDISNSGTINTGSVRTSWTSVFISRTITQTGDVTCGAVGIQAWGTGYATTVVFSHLIAGAVTLGVTTADNISGILNLGSGTHTIASIAQGNALNSADAINFGTSNTSITGNANFTGIAVSNTSATLNFTGTTSLTTAGATLPNTVVNGTSVTLADATTFGSNSLTLTAGTFATGAYAVTNGGMTLQGATLTGSGTIAINGNLLYASGTNSHTGAWTQGTGSLNYGATTLRLYTVAANATITLTGQTYIRNMTVPTTATVNMGAYTINVGYGGSTNDFASLQGTWSRTGSGGIDIRPSASVSNSGPINIGSIPLIYDPSGSGTWTLTLSGSVTCGSLWIYGTSLATVAMQNNLTTGAITLGQTTASAFAGAIDFGTGNTDTITSIARGNASNSGDAVNFNTSTVTITGSADFTGIAVSNTSATVNFTATTGTPTLTSAGATLPDMVVNNNGVTSFTATDALSAGAFSMTTAGSKFTLANGVTNNFTSVNMTNGTLVDGNASTVNNVNGSGGTGANLTLTGGKFASLASWVQTASGNLSSPWDITGGNKIFASIQTAPATYTSTLTATLSFKKIIIGGGTFATGSRAFAFYFYGNNYWTDTAGGSITSTGGAGTWYITNGSFTNTSTITMPKATVITNAGGWNPTATLNGGFNIGSNTLKMASGSAGYYATLTMGNGSALTAGAITLGETTAADKSGVLNLGSGTHSIASIVRGNAANSADAINFDTSNTSITGNADFTGIAVTTGASTVTLNGTGAQTLTSSGAVLSTLAVTNASAAGVTFADRLQAATLTDTTDASKLSFAAASAGSPHAITSALNITGGASKITLAPSVAATTWYISAPSPTTVTNAIVSYSNSTNHITPVTSTDGGNNVNWDFDTAPPTVTDNAPASWQKNNFVVTLACDDGAGSCAKVYYTIDNTTPTTTSSYVDSASSWRFTQATEGDYVLKYRGLDTIGNIADPVTAANHLRLDKVAPAVSDDVPSGWQNADIVVTLTCDDATGGNSGCSKVFYTLDGSVPDADSPLFVDATSTWQFTYSTSTTDSAVLKYRGFDAAGNLGSVVTAVNSLQIDKATPVISNVSPSVGANISRAGQIVTFTLNKVGDCRLATSARSYDSMSGDTVCSVQNGIQMSCVLPNFTGYGNKNVYLACEDSLGNKDTAGSATHLMYNIPGSTMSFGGGYAGVKVTPVPVAGYMSAPAGPFAVVINDGANVVGARNVTLKLSAGAGATAVILSNDPDFSRAVTIPFQNSYEYDLCHGSANCLDQNYVVYVKFLGSSGAGSPVFSAGTYLRTSSFTDQLGGKISDLIGIFEPKKEENVNFPPIAISVPKETPFAFQHVWTLAPSSVQDFVFADLPADLRNVVQKFPQIADTLKKVGITRMSQIGQLEVAQISLPTLAESAGLPSTQSFAINDLSSSQSKAVPSNVVFARAGENNLDLNVKLSINNQGDVAQTLNTIQGHPLTLAIKPDKPASEVKGYLIFKSNRVARAAKSLTASVVSAVENTDLVLNQFDYKDSGNGIWTADVISPSVLGQYELRTVVNYKDKKVKPEQVSMIVVVDPEGYVFEKLSDGREVRVIGAEVSIYWLDPETHQYELWPAKDFRQQNPQTTDVTGRYAFLVPPGSYYLKAVGGSYSDYQSEVFKVEENKGVFMNIELKSKISWLKLFNLPIILLGGIFIALVCIFMKLRSRKS